MKIIHGDCLEKLKEIPDNSIDSIVTDPPYGLSFMGKHWDYDVPSEEVWKECLRVLKPGGHLLSFAGTRTQHRMAVRIEDAGFEIRDMIAWVYGQGFPKSLNIGKAVDKIQGNEREVIGEHPNPAGNKSGGNSLNMSAVGMPETAILTKGTSPWEGWGTALKPALEPITVARKPLIGTVAENVLTHGTGGLNIDGSRVGTEIISQHGRNSNDTPAQVPQNEYKPEIEWTGRFPANLIHDGSEEVLECFPNSKSSKGKPTKREGGVATNFAMSLGNTTGYEDEGSAARFFYCAKASKKDRDEGLEGFEEKPSYMVENGSKTAGAANGERYDRTTVQRNNHPTVKPTALMRYLVKLVTPPGGTVLDPFTGSGSTGKACKLEGFEFIGIEREEEYVKIAEARIEAVIHQPTLV